MRSFLHHRCDKQNVDLKNECQKRWKIIPRCCDIRRPRAANGQGIWNWDLGGEFRKAPKDSLYFITVLKIMTRASLALYISAEGTAGHGNYYLVLEMRALELRMTFHRYIIFEFILLSTIALKEISAFSHPAVFPGFHVSRAARGREHEIATSRQRRARSIPLTMSEMSEDYPSDTGDDRFSSDGESSSFFQVRMPLRAGHRLFYDFIFEL